MQSSQETHHNNVPYCTPTSSYTAHHPRKNHPTKNKKQSPLTWYFSPTALHTGPHLPCHLLRPSAQQVREARILSAIGRDFSLSLQLTPPVAAPPPPPQPPLTIDRLVLKIVTGPSAIINNRCDGPASQSLPPPPFFFFFLPCSPGFPSQ